jgi:alkanesulfonate monooxygenase SsuD/methylene tetrahydromethanopterin reductase-like flavin-dependent oxidoreductase (luciferase family)
MASGSAAQPCSASVLLKPNRRTSGVVRMRCNPARRRMARLGGVSNRDASDDYRRTAVMRLIAPGSVEIGAARSRRTPSRAQWRLVREIFVADTDAEALRLSAGGMMGRMMQEYFLPLLASFQFTEFLKHRPDVPDSDVTPEYCARHNWLVGSPATVTERLQAIYDEVGGFGTLLLFCFDYADNPQAWRHSMELLAREVMPKFKGLVPG